MEEAGHPQTQGPSLDPRRGTHETVAASLLTRPFMQCGSDGCEVAPSRPPPSRGTAPLGMENIDRRQAGELPREAAPPEQKAFMVAPGDTGTSPGTSGSRAGAGKAWPRGGWAQQWARRVGMAWPSSPGTRSSPKPAEGAGGAGGDVTPVPKCWSHLLCLRDTREGPEIWAPKSHPEDRAVPVSPGMG